MPIYSPTGFLDITNATLRTSNTECQNLQIGSGNVYVTTDLTSNLVLNLENITNLGATTSNTVVFSNVTTGLTVSSNLVATGNITAGTFLGNGSGLTNIPPSAITGTLSQWSDGTNSDVYIASNVGIGNVHTLTSNTLQVGANLYVRDADANVLTVTGNVAATRFVGDGSLLTGIASNLHQVVENGNVTSNTVQFTNATTGFITTSNVEIGGTLKINTISAAAYQSLQSVTDVSNSTSNTVQFTNATTGFTTTSNIDVGGRINMGGHMIPTANEQYDIGSAGFKIRDMYVSDNSLWIGDEAKISFTGNQIKFRRRKKSVVPSGLTTLGATHSKDAATVQSEALASASGVSTVADMKLHHWMAYAKSLDTTKTTSDIFTDSADDYEASAASEAFKEVGSDIYSAYNVSIGKSTAPTTALDVNGTVTATAFVGAMPNLDATKITTGTLDRNTTGSAAKLTATVDIGGVPFDGSAAITPTTFGGATFSGDVAFDTNTLFVDVSANRIGIGTVSPLEACDIHGVSRISAAYPRLDFYTTTRTGSDTWGNSTNAAGDYRIYANGDASDGTKRSLNFDYGQNSAHTSRMVINAAGNVGIGVTGPTAPLSVAAVGSTTLSGESPSTNGIYLYNDTNAANEDATITMRVAGSSAGDPKLSWDISGSAGFTMGVDNSDSDKFKLCGNWYDLNQGQYMEIDKLGNTIFDVGKGGGTILSGLYNYTETQQAIDAGVQGGAGTITASTDIVPPPGTAGDVIAKFVNTAGGEAVTGPWVPGVITIAVNTVIYFGVWIYATENINMEFFRFHDTGAQNVAFSYTTPNKWVWFEKTITSNRSYNNSSFRFDNNSSTRTVYLTGVTIRVGQSQNTGLPFTPRYSPIGGKGPVFTTQNLVAKQAAIKTLTGNVGIGTTIPQTSLQIKDETDTTGTGDGFITGLNANSGNRKPTECLRLQGKYHAAGSGPLLRFTNFHTSGSNPSNDEYNLGGIAGFDYASAWGGGLCFYTAPNTANGGDLTARMVIDSSGKVGIGKTDPSCTLDVYGTSTTSGIFSTRLWLTAVGDNSGNGSPDDNTGSPWYGLGYDNLAWNNQSYKYSGDIPILSGYSGVALRSGYGNLVLTTAGKVGIGTTDPQASLHVNGNKAIINGQSSVQTVNVYKTAGGNSGAQTVRYYRVYVPNGYTNFQVILRGFARNNSGGGDIQAWRRQYTVQRNSGGGVTITHNSGENINATGFTFNTSQTGGVTDTIEIHFDVTFPPKPDYATYITFKADVIGDSGSFANTSGI